MTDITLVKLKTEGRLCTGDTVSTPRLGECTVTTIESTHTLTVRRNFDGKYFRLSGMFFGADARLETRGAA